MKNEFNIPIDGNKKIPNFAHFGGKPFAGMKNNDPYENLKEMRNDYMNINNDNNFNNLNNNNNRNNNLNNKNNDDFVIHKKKESVSVEKKDANIWDAPEDRNKNFKPKPNIVMNNKQPAGRKISNPSNKVQNNSDIESSNHNRKIQKNEKKVESKKDNMINKKKDANVVPKEGDKKTFLMERYPPNGVGPDSELIEMLEREVVDTNPCVKFDDIAELEGAKNILKEAVLLPILMPQYFKVRLLILPS